VDNSKNNQTINNKVVNEYLVTMKVDTISIDKEQLKSDLELLKAKEILMNSRSTAPIAVKKKKILLKKMKITDVDVLRLKNPFKGE